MIDLFISDLHLDESRSDCTACLTRFLKGPARQADRLFILGDLFEAWIGDDVITEMSKLVAAALSDCADHGTQISFLAGNRDFLLGQHYASSAGMQLLQEPVRIMHDELEMTLLHGDQLCTDDIEYQRFRRLVRTDVWQSEFLSKPISERLEFASEARLASQKHTGEMASEIMDVNQQAVIQFMNDHKTDFVIHGHTHRPDIHQFDLNHFSATRIVLGDWYEQGSVLMIKDQQYDLQSLAF